MAKQNSVTLDFDDGAQKIAPSAKLASQIGVRAKLLRFAKLFSSYIVKRRRRPAGESYIPRKSHEDESRLEFERFLHW